MMPTFKRFVAAKSKILENIGFWFRNRPLLGISPGEKQSTLTADFFADSRRCASSVNKTLHSFESLSVHVTTGFVLKVAELEDTGQHISSLPSHGMGTDDESTAYVNPRPPINPLLVFCFFHKPQRRVIITGWL